MDNKEGINFVVCKLCQKHFKFISCTHLRKYHDMSVGEYMKEFPDASIQSEELGKRRKENWKRAMREGGNWFQSEEARKKNSESHNSEECSKKMLLKWQDSEYREMQSEAHKGKYGPNASNWQGGISELLYPFAFDNKLKKQIRNKDNNTCQLCGRTKEEEGKNLCVHHINYDRDDLFELNFITLCRGCNGKVNSRRDFWEDYFTFKLLYGIAC